MIGNDGWESVATDIIGIHDYDANAGAPARSATDRRRDPSSCSTGAGPAGAILTLDGYPHRGQPIMLTEFGGIAFSDPESATNKTWGYSRGRRQPKFAALFETLLETVIHTALFSGFCYTQFADTFQEANGLLYADRTPKIPIEQIAKATRQSRMHIVGGV